MRKLGNVTRKVLIASFITFILSLIALSNGWGYRITEFNIDYASLFELDPIKSALPTHVKVSLNPFLFPINYVYNTGVISCDYVFIVYVKRGVRIGENVGSPFDKGSNPGMNTVSESAEVIAANLVFSELSKNLPYYFFMGLSITYLADRLLKRLTRKD